MKLNIFCLCLSLISPVISQNRNRRNTVVLGYFAPWNGGEIDSLPLWKYTHINYSFGLLYKKNDPAHIVIDPNSDAPNMKKLVAQAHRFNSSVSLSVGGWTGGQTFSTVVKKPELRKKFIDECIVFLKDTTWTDPKTGQKGWGFDGIDIDWEYPGKQGISCNAVDKMDTANYEVLLKELRREMDKQFPRVHKLITAAVSVTPFAGSDGKPMKDVSSIMRYFDYISIMAYDLFGPWSDTTGPNAPLDADTTRTNSKESANQAITWWLAAKAPANKLVVGTPFYGRTAKAKENMLLDRDNMYQQKESTTPKGDESDSQEVSTVCPEAPTYSGFYNYKFLRKDILVRDPFTPRGDWVRVWDRATKTPWLFNRRDRRFISYDDPDSIRLKVDTVKRRGLRGVMTWNMNLDYRDELVDTLNTIFW